jgi:hypothetical protein
VKLGCVSRRYSAGDAGVVVCQAEPWPRCQSNVLLAVAMLQFYVRLCWCCEDSVEQTDERESGLTCAVWMDVSQS